MIDLMKLKVQSSENLTIVRGGVIALAPWATLDLEELAISSGWFKLTATGSNGVCLQMSQIDGFKVVELAGHAEAATYVRFDGGLFKPRLLFGVRPGFYPVKEVFLSRVSFVERMLVMARRLTGALRNKTSFAKIFDMAKLVIGGRGTFGLRANSSVAANGLGLLTAADLARFETEVDKGALLWRVSALTTTPTFLLTYRNRPIAISECIKLGLQSQAYDLFHLDHNIHHDYKIVIDENQTLVEDALLLFAEAVNRNGNPDVVLADVWCGDVPTTRVSFDPLLYFAEEYPTPYAIKPGSQVAVTDRWKDKQDRYAVISVPVAKVAQLHNQSLQPNIPSPSARPFVSVIIPTRDKAELLSSCLSGLFENTNWPHEVIVVDNGSVEEQTFDIFKNYASKGLRVIRQDIEFNFSTLCNVGASYAKGDVIVFMNNDITLIDSSWMEDMVRFACMTDVGAVGARLHYSDLSLQHGGIALGLTETCGHMYHGLSFQEQEKIPCLTNASLRSAVTAALLCVEKKKFDRVGGFDAIHFPVTLNDVDLCLKLQAVGFFTVYSPSARAFHLEGVSRGKDLTPEKIKRRTAELEQFNAKWQTEINNDPWLSAAYSRASEMLTLR